MKPIRSLLAGLAAAATMITGAHASDLLVGADPFYPGSSLFNFEGFYLGATAGIGMFPTPETVGSVGLIAGTNFAVTDAILAGVEFQGDVLWNGTGYAGANALFLGKLGSYLNDNTVVYAAAGGGWVANTSSYALGAGIEMAVAGPMSVRGEIMGTGSWGGWFDGAKATAGVIWHMN